MSCYVVQFDLKLANELRTGLEHQGFSISQPPHTLFQGKKKGVSCTLYASGKLTVQGTGTEEFVTFYLEPEILKTFNYLYRDKWVDRTPRIGVDESGKGDYFGPLCVAAVYADEHSIDKLLELGVKDSKKMSDRSVAQLAPKIKKCTVHSLVKIGPNKYNELIIRFGNLNLLLGWGHATAISNLLDQVACEKIIIDQFAAEHIVQNAMKQKKKAVVLTQMTRAEQDPVVAAASILARASFLEEMQKLGEQVGSLLPKGASPAVIAQGKKLVSQHGKEILQAIAKLHFKTTNMILE